jgi:hypothetical protein
MTDTSQEKPGSAFATTNPKYWVGVEAEDIPQGWMDHMLKRLFDAMNRNLIRLETAQAKVNDENKTSTEIIKETTQHQRVVTHIRTDMERVRKLEMKKQAKKPEVMLSDDEERTELQREIDRIIAADNANKADPGTAG